MTESEQQIQREPVPKSEPVSQPAPSPLAPPTPPSRPRRRAVWIAGIIAVLLLTLGIVPRLGRNKEAAQTAHMAAQAEPNVSVVRAKLAPATAELALPGNTEPINVAVIYARASGYIGRRYADIGTHVKAGQMLAKIE